MRAALFLGLFAWLAGMLPPAARAQAFNPKLFDPWVVYYRDDLPARAFFDYRLAVFDADKHPPLQPLFERDITLLGYISFGEVESYRPDFAEVKAAGYMLMENPYWPGSYFVDIRDPRWAERVVGKLAAKVWDAGFHGFFLDTLDNPAHLEREDPVRFKGMTAAAVRLVKMLRQRFPQAKIMLNRGFELHMDVAKDVDFILAESLRARFDADRNAYVLTPEDEYRQHVASLDAARKLNPQLGIMTLDYWEPSDAAMLRQIYAGQRARGYLPYVSIPALDRVVVEPK